MRAWKSKGRIWLLCFALAAPLVPAAAMGDQNEALAVAIWFVEADGTAKPYLFYDINAPFSPGICEARLEYLTKKFYRMSRSNPELKDKQAVRSACVPIDFLEQGGN